MPPRTFVAYPITDFPKIKIQMLNWASRFNIFAFLDNQCYQLPFHRVEGLLAAGAVDTVQASAGHALEDLRHFASRHKDWLFGHFAYGLVKETEPFGPDVSGKGDVDASRVLSVRVDMDAKNDPATGDKSANERPAAGDRPDLIGFPDLFFFVPEIIIELKEDCLRIGSLRQDHDAIMDAIRACPEVAARTESPEAAAGVIPAPAARGAGGPDAVTGVMAGEAGGSPVLQPVFSREEYLAIIKTLQQHILRGDCYEINFCQEFFSHPAGIHPLDTWLSLSKASPNPFSAFYKLEDKYLLCASPERYLRREGNTLISQPMKGTAPRAPNDPSADEAAGIALQASAKDRSENVMVVDLVRNDLSKICLPGSVRVEELFGVYSFPQVFQMVSTVKGDLPPGIGLIEAIKASFPMGSMTGAPKKRVVELIDRYERSSRGLFSGALGYITPEGDFDFNVIIRSLFYNPANQYLSYQVGSGITFYSDPEQEYEECLVKAEGIKKALGQARRNRDMENTR